MATKSTTKKKLIGGKNAALVNPHQLVKMYKAVCITDHIYLSPEWRNTKVEARQDAIEHIQLAHYIDYEIKISG